MSFSEYLDWLVQSSDLFPAEIETDSENRTNAGEQMKF
jgi:hypothetical protein